MALRRQFICHLTENVSFIDDGHAVKVAHSDLRGGTGSARRASSAPSDRLVNAALAWVKERSRAH